MNNLGKTFALNKHKPTLCRSWHDEAYLYINQAITQEKPNIDRKDVALMMYQKGLGLLDLALCVDTESGSGECWVKARTMQQKMGKTRDHVESRITALTDILAPPPTTAPPRSAPARPPAPPAPAQQQPPSYEEVMKPPSYTQTVKQENGGPVTMTRSETSESVKSDSEQGEILFSMAGVQVSAVL